MCRPPNFFLHIFIITPPQMCITLVLYSLVLIYPYICCYICCVLLRMLFCIFHTCCYNYCHVCCYECFIHVLKYVVYKFHTCCFHYCFFSLLVRFFFFALFFFNIFKCCDVLSSKQKNSYRDIWHPEGHPIL